MELIKLRESLAEGVPVAAAVKETPTTTLNAFLIPSEDDHHNEYPPEEARRRQFITGFTGSTGLAVVTEEKAALWTDGRYWVQAERELNPKHWTLMKQGEPEYPKPGEFLVQTLQPGNKVGVDPRHFTHKKFEEFSKKLAKKDISLVCVAENPVDKIWEQYDRPKSPSGEIFVLQEKYAGNPVDAKLNLVRQKLQAKGCWALVVTALDEVAWLFNLRGSDVPYSPVFLAYAIITPTSATLYADEARFNPAVRPHLEHSSVTVKPYNAFFDSAAATLPPLAESGSIWVGDKCNEALWRLIPKDKAVEKTTPTAELKAIKNDTELQGMRNCHIRDAVALCRFFHWLEKQFEPDSADGTRLTEVSVADKAEQLRRQEEGFVSLSFPTISAIGANGAMPHYKPEQATCQPMDNKHLYLVDSGAQFHDGTTDVTRTMHFGQPTPEQKRAFTAVLKSHIALARTVFPSGTNGHALDTLARAPLWRYGLKYQHGTGHGVGSFLNVHEGPMLISSSPACCKHGLHAGNVVTIEPGYYKEDDFGIRIENVEIVAASMEHQGFLEFEAVTLLPIQAKMIEREMLTTDEVQWINAYHAKCRNVIGKQLQERNFVEEMEWLHRNTEPL